MDRSKNNPDPNDRHSPHRDAVGRRAARQSANLGQEGNDADAYAQEAQTESERELELTGYDAATTDAMIGDAGNGASPHGADLSGLEYDEENRDNLTSLEADPGDAGDIMPDQIQQGAAETDEETEDAEITARPRERYRPITPSMLPDDTNEYAP